MVCQTVTKLQDLHNRCTGEIAKSIHLRSKQDEKGFEIIDHDIFHTKVLTFSNLKHVSSNQFQRGHPIQVMT